MMHVDKARALTQTMAARPARMGLGAVAAAWLCAAAPGWAADAAVEPVPIVGAKEDPNAAEWINWTEGNLARRATVPGRMQGEVTLSTNSATAGNFGSKLDGVATGRIGLGYNLSAELSASRSASGNYRPGVGLKWQALDRGKIKLAVMGLFRPEGFNEPEGEVELHVIGSARSGRAEVNVNAVVGGDPDGKERDVEGVLGGGYRVLSNLMVGAEARSRFALGTKQEAWGMQEHVGGAVAQLDLSGFNISALAGAGIFQPKAGMELSTGLYGMARVGYRF